MFIVRCDLSYHGGVWVSLEDRPFDTISRNDAHVTSSHTELTFLKSYDGQRHPQLDITRTLHRNCNTETETTLVSVKMSEKELMLNYVTLPAARSAELRRQFDNRGSQVSLHGFFPKVECVGFYKTPFVHSPPCYMTRIRALA